MAIFKLEKYELSGITNQELSRRCKKLSGEIHEIMEDYRRRSSEMIRPMGSEYEDMSEEERTRRFWRDSRESSRRLNESISRYRRRYDGEAQAYLDELVRRGVLDEEKRGKMRITHVGGTHTIEEIAQTLSACATKLSVTE